MSARLVEEVLELFVKYSAVHEVGGNNRGPQVEAWLRNVGLPPGEPWCMAGLWSIVQEAAANIGEANPLVCTGSVAKQWRNAPHELKVFEPRRGCVFIHLDPDGAHGHTGLVEAVYDSGTFGTWECNSNKAGSREGDGVWHGVRPVQGYAVGYIDLNLSPDALECK